MESLLEVIDDSGRTDLWIEIWIETEEATEWEEEREERRRAIERGGIEISRIYGETKAEIETAEGSTLTGEEEGMEEERVGVTGEMVETEEEMGETEPEMGGTEEGMEAFRTREVTELRHPIHRLQSIRG